MDLDNIQRKYGLPAPLPVVQNGKFATRFPLNLEHRGDDVFQFGGKYIGEIENIYDLLYKILTNQEIDASLALPYAIKITEDKLYIRDKTNSEWILIFDITKPNFPKEIELYELIYKAITHQVIGEDTSYPGQFKIEENILYVRDKDNLTWTQIGDVTKEFLGATEATQAILEQVNDILTEVQELKTELNRQIATANETLITALKAANEAMISVQSINIRTFNSVEEMKASNTLKAGALAKTQGFYVAGDGGGADYLITDNIGEDEADESSIITLQNSLYAKLLVQDYVNVKQFGAKGNGEVDDTEAIQKAIDYSVGFTTFIPAGVYKFTNTIYIRENTNIMGMCLAGVQYNKLTELENLINANISTFYIDNTFNGDYVIKSDENALVYKIDGIHITGSALEKEVKGVAIERTDGKRGTTILKDIICTRLSGNAFEINKHETIIDNCISLYCKDGFYFKKCVDIEVLLLRAGFNNGYGVHFYNSYMCKVNEIDTWGNKEDGVLIDNSKDIYFTQFQSNGNEKNGLHFKGDTSVFYLTQGRFEDNSFAYNNTYSDILLEISGGTSRIKLNQVEFYGCNTGNTINKPMYAIRDLNNNDNGLSLSNCHFSDKSKFGTGILDSNALNGADITAYQYILNTNTNDTIYNYVKYVLDNITTISNFIKIKFTIQNTSNSTLYGRLGVNGETQVQGGLDYKGNVYKIYGVKSSEGAYKIYADKATVITE